MKRPILFTAAIIGLAAGIYSGLAAGQDFLSSADAKGNSASGVEMGSYKPLTFWASLTLGSAYYTNPHQARSINVAYSYDGPEFSDDFKNNAIWKLAREGKIYFGIVDAKEHFISVIGLSELTNRFQVHDASDLPRVLSRPDITVVASEKSLLGAASTKTVVKTSDKPQ